MFLFKIFISQNMWEKAKHWKYYFYSHLFFMPLFISIICPVWALTDSSEYVSDLQQHFTKTIDTGCTCMFTSIIAEVRCIAKAENQKDQEQRYWHDCLSSAHTHTHTEWINKPHFDCLERWRAGEPNALRMEILLTLLHHFLFLP